MSNEVIAGADQVFLDLAMQETGSVASLFDFALLSNMSITEDLINGNTYKKPDYFIDKTVVPVFVNRKPASADIGGIDELPGGIDYMQIGGNFKVS